MATTETAAPVDIEDFSARLSALGVGGGFAVAVSGGRDSMALARLAALHAKSAGVSVLALTVDHGLRPESASEAAQVARWCEGAGLKSKILVWRGEKPPTGVQEAARQARYRLLAEAVEAAGLDALLTAHSADDQAETVFMRLARGAGPRGLSAMSEATWIAAGAGKPARLARPLLDVSRARLTATVEAFGQAYIDDPSNDDPGYERVKTRALLAALEEQGLLTQDALLRVASRMGAADRRLRAQEKALFQTLGGCFYAWGGASLDLRFCADRLAVAGPLCRRLIHAVSGEPHAPDENAAFRAFAAAMETGAASLGGTLLKSFKDRLWFLREPGAVLGRAGVQPLAPAPLAAGRRALWDNRFLITVPEGASDLEIAPQIAPLGEAGLAALGPAAALFSGPREGLLSAPGVYCKGALILAPGTLSMAGCEVSMRPLGRERFDGGIIRFS